MQAEASQLSAPSGWYGRLVVGFVNFSRWPLAKKYALVISAAFVFQGMFLLSAELLDHPGSVFDINQYRPAGLGWLLYSFLTSIFCAWISGKGGWTDRVTLLLLLGYLTGMLIAIEGLGGAAGAFGMFPIATAMAGFLIFGPRVGSIGALYVLLGSSLLNLAHQQGWLPLGGALRSRSVDAMNETTWYVLFSVVNAQFALFMGVMAALLFSARDYAERALQKQQNLIRRYVPSQVADAIISGHAEMTDKHERRKLTIFFSDLVGFTDLSEELEPEDLSRLLNEYFSAMTAIAQRHGGTVDELSGDAILIFFGAPVATDDKDHALRAVHMAREMQQAMKTLNAKWRSAGITEALDVRMGINTGLVTVGNFGSPERTKYAALGKHVNLAARLQAHCEPGKVLLSHATWLLVSDQVACAAKGELQLKGIHRPVMTYELSA